MDARHFSARTCQSNCDANVACAFGTCVNGECCIDTGGPRCFRTGARFESASRCRGCCRGRALRVNRRRR